MKRILYLFLMFPIFFSINSFSQEVSSGKCNINLIKNNLTRKFNNITDYKTDIRVKFEGLTVMSNVIGLKPDKMKIQQVIVTPEYSISYLEVFDGKYQYVESRRDKLIQVVKLHVSKLSKRTRPFDTGYYLMGTGLLNGEDYIGTFVKLLNLYNLESTCNKNTLILSGKINVVKFRNYALNIKTKRSSIEYINKYTNKFGYFSIEVNKVNMDVYNYKLGSSDKNIIFEASFSNANFNQNIDSDVFLYTPPSGVTVADITSEVKINNEQ